MADRGHDVRGALLFDLDGTLVDSDAQHFAAFQRIFAPHGIALDLATYSKSIHGASNELIGKIFLSHLTPEQQNAALDEKEATYRAGLDAIEPIAGAVALIDFADRHGLGRAVVTNAPRANADAVLAAIGLDERLSIVIVGAELARAKPDPLPYLAALERTGALGSRSVAFEDSTPGIRAAVEAGIAVVGMMSSLGELALVRAGALFAARDFTDPRIYGLIEARVNAPAKEEEARQ